MTAADQEYLQDENRRMSFELARSKSAVPAWSFPRAYPLLPWNSFPGLQIGTFTHSNLNFEKYGDKQI